MSRVIVGDRVGVSDPPAWLAASYRLFRSHVMDSAYPCFFGTQAERAGEMFYSYVSSQDLAHLPGTMATFIELSSALKHEKNNFALFFEPEPAALDHDEYRTLFWRTLQLLHDNDTAPASGEETLDPSSPSWEFAFNGQQLFVVGCAPSYRRRRSRNLGPGMVMLFQPRTVFVDAVTKRAIGPQARAEVRGRLVVWDGVPHHPDLGVYGDPENREWKQYFLPDDQEAVMGVCPFMARERGMPTIESPPMSEVGPVETGATVDRVDPPFANLIEALGHHAAFRPDQVAIRFLVDGESREDVLTYAQLDQQARRLAEDMSRRAQRGDRALLLLPNGIEYAVAFFACLYAGVIAVPAYPPEPANPQHLIRLQAMQRDCGPRLLLTDSAHQSLLSNLTGHENAEVVIVGRERADASDWVPGGVAPEDVAFLQYTSGSTSTPKGVIVSHANLMANEEVLRSAMALGAGDVMVSWLPLYHDMGLILGLLAPICFCFPVVLMTPQHFVGRPSRWLKAVSRYRGTVSGAPDFAFQLCVDRIGDDLVGELDLRSWRLAWCGAEPIRLATTEAFAARFGRCGLPSNALYPCYGLAEATLMVSGGLADAGPLSTRFSAEGLARGEAVPGAAGTALMDCGMARPGHEIRIVDPTTLVECAEGRVGEIWVAGPSVAGGYWKNAAATKEIFQARLKGDASSKPHLRTGDLGFLMDGRLFISGRHKDLIIVRGQNLYPQDIEQAVSERVPDLRKGRIAAFPVMAEGSEAIGIAAELPRARVRRRDAGEIFRAITDAVASTYQEPVGVILLLKPGTLPRTTSGKLRRSACLALWQDGSLDPEAVLARDGSERPAADTPASDQSAQGDVEQRVAAIWQEVFGHTVRAGEDFFDLGGQSLTAAQLAARLSDAFDLELPIRWVFETRTIAELARRLQEKLAARQPGDRRPPLRARTGQDRLPLSLAQERLWFLWCLDPSGNAYNVTGAWRLSGSLDVAALRSAVKNLVARHEILRTRIEEGDGQAVQVVGAEPAFGWEQRDLSGLVGPDQAVRLQRALQEMANAPFDLARGPMLKVQLLKLSEQQHVLVLAMHHIVSDGWSVSILLKELGLLYEAARDSVEANLPSLPIQYADYALWQRQTLTEDALSAQLAYWRERLGAEHPVLRLSAPKPGGRSRVASARVQRAVPDEVVTGLRLLSRARGATLFMTLLAAFDVVLSRYSGQRDLRVAVPAAGRQRVESEGLIGFFVNTLVIRAELTGAMRFTDLLEQVRERVLEAQANQDLPFERIVADLQPQRQPGRNPIASVKFLLQPDWAGTARFPGLECEPIDVAADAARFDLALDVLEFEAGLACQFTYATDLVDVETVARLADDYVALLVDITRRGDLRVSDVGSHGVGTALQRDPQHCDSILARVAMLAAERRTDVALMHEGAQLDWASLWARSGRLAGRLVQLGVTQEIPVAVCLPRSLALVASMLAVWRAGGVYVPLDPSMPEERLAWQVTDSGAHCVIAEDALPWLPEGVVRVDPNDTGTTPPDTTAPRGDQAAYITYTSGSMGRPKGVVVSHRSTVSYVRALLDRVPAGIASAALVSTPAADLGNTVLFGSLWAGWTLHLISEARAFDPDGFADYMAEHRVDALKIVPSHLGALLAAARPQDVLPERCLIVGGEATNAALASRIAVLKPRCQVMNHYGPTETTVGVMTRQGTDTMGATLPLGWPLSHSRIHLLDVDGNPAPQGAPGEICIGGEGVARGYFRRPGLTAERFVPDEYGPPGSRLYRTGDNARQLTSGEFEFIGRLDDQVKVRGYRVEPEEVAVRLRVLAGVREAVVIGRADEENRLRLLGYVTGDELDGAGLRKALAAELPDYMVPSAIVVLRSWPLNRNGKIDRRALPDPDKETSSAQVAPRNEKEALLLQVWQSVLKCEKIGVTENFFELGGDSILSLQVVAKVRRAGLKLTPKQAFEHPTIEGAARVAVHLATIKPVQAAVPASSSNAAMALGDTELERLGLRRNEVQEVYPATPLQQGLIYHALLQAGQGFYLRQLRLRLPAALDRASLRAVWQAAVMRHDVLRTHIEWRHGGEALQVVHRQAALPYEEHDWSAEDPAAYEDRFAAWLAADLARGIDLAMPPLMRVNLFLRPDGAHDLIWSGHHVLLDGWSAAQLLSEMRQDYQARLSGGAASLPARTPYRDYVAWLQQQPSTEAWWRSRLGELRDAAGLTESLGRPHDVEPGMHHLNQKLDAQLCEHLKGAAQQRQVTLNMLMQGAWAILLARYGGRQRVVFGATVSGRPAELAGAERMLGLFINSLPVAVDVSGATPITEWLQRLQRHNVELREYEHTPLSDLQRWAGMQGGALFDNLLVFENYPVDDVSEAGGLPVTAIESLQRTHYPLTLTVERGMTLSWAWDGTQFDRASIVRLSGHYREILERLISDGPVCVGEIGLSVAPRAGRSLTGHSFHSVMEQITQRVAAHPSREALRCAETRLSYGELAAWSNRIGWRLRQVGVAREERIGICLERSVELVAGVLGVLKAGGAYVPLDPSYPADRLRHMIEDSGIRRIVTEREIAARLGAPFTNLELVIVSDVADEPSDALQEPVHPEQLAYVIYTSGSTGRPKGVAISHGSLDRFLASMRERPGLTQDDVWVSVTSLSFDICALELYLPLIVGARIEIAPRDVVTDGRKLVELVESSGASVMQATPATWKLLLESRWSGRRALKVLCGGEAMPADLAVALLSRGAELWNMYGPTETTIWSAVGRIARGDAIALGEAIHETELHLIDESGQPVPVGGTGELCIGGANLARGYLNRPALTADHFVPDPFAAPGRRLYRTGDLCRWGADGLEFLGRLDQQVKLRGFRIELGEIESELRALEGVAQAVAVGREDAPGDKRLIAYLVPNAKGRREDGVPHDAARLREQLRTRLPDYMVPSQFVVLDALPMTPNGKIDRRALPTPERWEVARVHAEPRTPTEKILAGIWADVLGIAQVGVQDDFYLLGGHSLTAMRLVSRIGRALDRVVSLQTLFAHPVLADLAAEIDRQMPAADDTAIARRPAGQNRLPLSHGQERLWFLWRLEPESPAYNLSGALRITGELDVAALRTALEAMVARHESLRVRVEEVDGVAFQVIDTTPEFAWSTCNLATLPEVRRPAKLDQQLRDAAAAPFDLRRGRLLRARLVKLNACEQVLVLAIHHIIADGWSIGVLLRELSALYVAAQRGTDDKLPTLPIQYGDYVLWQRERFSRASLEPQLNYWRDRLGNEQPVLALPTDRTRRGARRTDGGHLVRTVDAAVANALGQLSRTRQATLFMTLLAAFDALLARYSGEQDLRVGIPVTGRRQQETEGLIGFFVNTLVLRAELSGAMPFGALLAQVRERVLEAQANQDLPLAQVIEALQPQRDPSHTPLFQVMFNLDHGDEDVSLEWPGLELTRLPAETAATQFDLTLTVRETGDGLRLSFGYASDLFDAATIERLAAHYEDVLKAICADPDVRVGHIALRAARAAPAMIYPFRPVAARITAQITARSEAEAVSCQGSRLSFGELETWSNRIARRLQRLGVGSEERVGLCVERSAALVAGLLGVLKAGGAYVPLDPSYPPARLRAMIEDAGLRRVVTDSSTARRLAELLAGCEPVIVSEVDGEPAESLDLPIHPDQLAYVIYTSGSTGMPKGVAISHGALSHHIDEFLGRYAVRSSERVLQFATVSFDIAAHELLPPLTVGACVVMRGPDMWDSDTLNQQLLDERVNVAFLPTAYWQQWLHRLPPALPSLRQMTVGGEALPGDALKRWQAGPLSGVRLDNLYGPTETTIAALFHETRRVDGDQVVVPIGRPFPGRRIHLLDAEGNSVPAGGFGELCIVGDSLARGYLDRPGLTAERFVPDPFGVPGSRLYRTGDLCRQRADGTVEFLGRLDRQIKLRGFRIEIGEIETALRRCAQVREAVAVVKGEGERRRLIGYIVGDADPVDVQRELALGLPDHMVPSAVLRLPALPLMANGKMDYKGLPEPAELERDVAVAPRTDAEATLLAIWQGVLKRKDVGATDNFFSLGGDSILSLQVIARAREAGLKLTPKQMFEHPTIAGSAAIAVLTGGHAGAEPAVAGVVPLSPIQAWFFERHPDGPSHWNQAILLRVIGELDAGVLDACLKTLVARHDALRLRFERSSGSWQQHVAAHESNALLECIDLDDAADRAMRIETEGARLQQGLDLAHGPLLKAGYFRGGQERRLLVAIHHLAVDGVSWRVLLEELQQILGQLERGEPVSLPPPSTPWSVWTTRLSAYAARPLVASELGWWQRMLAPAVGVKLPVKADGDRTMGASCELTFRLSTAATRRLLEQASRAYRMRPDEVMLAALTQTLANWSGQQGALIDLEGHGREDVIEDAELSGTVGWFTTRFPVWLAAEGEPDAVLIGAKARLRAVPHRGLHFGLLQRFADTETATTARALPKGEVSFNYLGQFDHSFGGDGRLTFLPESSGRSVAASSILDHVLDLNGLIVDGVLTLRWRFSPDIVAEPIIRGLIDDFGARLERLVSHCAATQPTVTASDFALSGLQQEDLDRLELNLDGVQDIYPATPLQQGLMYHSLLQQRDGVYVNQVRFTLSGELDRSALHAAWDAAVARHDVLRTSFEWRHGGDALQIVHRQARLPWSEHDWSTEDHAAYQARLAAWCVEDLSRGFALAAPPLMRMTLFARSDGAHDLIWTFHHALMDGWSGAQLLSEIARDYRARLICASAAPSVSQPYREYVAWLRRQPSAEAWWQTRLRASGAAAGLTESLRRPQRTEPGTHRIREQLDPALADRLRRIAQRRQVTLNTLIQGAWAIVLARFAGRRHVVFGATMSGRPSELPGVEQMLGLFINSLPVWVDVAGEATVTAWLQQLQRQNGELRQYEHTPLSDVQRWAGQSGDALFDSLVAFENYPVDAFMQAEEGALPVTSVEFHERTHYPLTLTVVPRADVSVLWAWDGERLDRESVELLSRHYRAVLEQLADDRERCVGEIALSDEAPATRAMATYAFRPLTHRIAAQAAAYPDREAVTDGARRLSYRELEAWSNRIGRRLRRLGVAPDQRVGLCVERSSGLIAGMLGVLKAGGAYVPLDPSYPEERLRHMLEDSGIRQVVVDRVNAERLRKLFVDRKLVVLSEVDDEAADPLEQSIHPEQLAYVIYTSGSTGRPKGVGVTHRNAARLFDATQEWFRFSSDDVWTLFHSYAFDFSAWEVFGALVHCGRLVVVPQQTARDPRAFHALLRRERVTVLNQTPSAFMALMHVDATAEQPADSLRAIVFGGEKLEPAALARWHAARGVRAPALINMYGITETTVHVTYRPLVHADIHGKLPLSVIGVPIPDLTLHVLDHDLNPVPVGAVGELHVGGAGLARGYLNRAGLTAERFLPDPFGPAGGRLYRSGDLARRLPGGELEYIGRNDGQVKVRGFRVELGEIEAALLAHPQVREAAVLSMEDGHGGHSLAAYAVAGQAEPGAEALRIHLEARLPPHMVPASFTFLASLPLTINGKLDRGALPHPASSTAAHVAPRTDTERVLCRVFADVLGVSSVGVQDNFFLLGGHSLSAVRTTFRLSEEFGRDVGLAALFHHPTAAAFAEHLDAQADADAREPSASLMGLLDGLD
jgi:amino acid adenylation domain-containing protein/non-ribosomal peptide synthase protein (TIGR01720 family)